ncbi:MAG: hypothetical protein ACRCWY_00160, partial [Cellulosilyticaceae bacterium]
LDSNIKEHVNQTEVLPESVKRKTQLAYEEIKSMKKSNKKRSTKKWAVAASLVVAGALCLQTPLMADIKELLFGGNFAGVESALASGAMQPFEGIISESNGIQLEVVGGFIDPTIIHLKVVLTAEDPTLFQDFKYEQHSKRFVDQFNMKDGQGRILQEIHDEGVYMPPFINEQGEKIYLTSTSTENVNTYALKEGKIEVDMIFNSSAGNYGDIQELTLQSNQLNAFTGDWTVTIPLASETPALPSATYEVTTPNSHIQITSAVAITSGIKIDCIITAPIDEDVIHSTLVGENGDVFTTGRPGWMETVPEGHRVALTFDVLASELGDSFTLQIPTLNQTTETVVLSKVTQ